MKNITAEMTTHLQQEVTTLATCWKVTRTDSTSLYFTDHDQDITFDGDVYEAATGYTRSAVENTSEMAVDNLDMVGILDSESISREDLRAGIYDYAYIEVFLVNWEDTTQGAVRLRAGRLGEVSLTQAGEFKAELRGLSQALSQGIVDVYTPNCRADFGDARCGIELFISTNWVASTAYSVGDKVIPTYESSYEGVVYMEGLDGEGETLAGLGWGQTAGMTASTATEAEGGVLDPAVGTYLTKVKNSTSLTTESSIYLERQIADMDVDVGEDVWFSAFAATPYGDTYSEIELEIVFTDGSDIELDRTGTGKLHYSDVAWHSIATPHITIPAFTAHILCYVTVSHTSDPDNPGKAVIDGIELFSEDRFTGPWPVAFQCTTAGTSGSSEPTWPTTSGQNVNDGSVVWQSYTQRQQVANVSNVGSTRTTFTTKNLSVNEEHYIGGTLKWISGENTGYVCEINNLSGGDVTLYLPPPYAIQEGDVFTVYPGCDKQLETCRDRFSNAINFRGEPFIPGQDEYLTYPDAK